MQEALAGLVGTEAAESATPTTITLRLPSGAKGPGPSPALRFSEEEAYNPGKLKGLQSWVIPALAFEPALALAFEPALALEVLVALPLDPPRGVVFGETIHYWSEAARLVQELLLRQNFVPTVREVPIPATSPNSKTTYLAAWQILLLADDDQHRFERLVQAMPPVGRALVTTTSATATTTDKPQAVTTTPQTILTSFLDRTVEATLTQQFRSAARVEVKQLKPLAPSTPLPMQWLQALLGGTPDMRLVGTQPELKTFANQIYTWLQQLQPPPADAAFRTCFKLEPPTSPPDLADSISHYYPHQPGNEQWQLSFHLQANDDRSLLLGASQVWQERTGTLTFLKRRFENPQERLLADLGRAARLFPPLENSLKTARPVEMRLDTTQAYTFLRQAAPLLEQSGYGVLLPAWWSKPSQRLGVRLKLKPKQKAEAKLTSGLLGLDGLVQYDWELALGQERLSAAEFEKLAKLKVPLVQIRGQWVELQPEQLEAAIAFFEKQHPQGEMTLGEALRLGLGGDTMVAQAGLPVTGIEAEGWLKEMLTKLSTSDQLTTLPPPPQLKATLRPYQLKGLSWLAFLKQFQLGACLADDMGLGKSLELISLLLHERPTAISQRQNGSPASPGPTLLVCPMSIVGNWVKEVEKFAPSLKVMVHHGAERLSGEAFEAEVQKHDLVLTTYGLVHRDEAHLARISWERIALDEAQNIKNRATKQSQTVRKLNTRYRVALTGTPVENRLSELWSIMDFLNPGYLGAANDFRNRFATPIEKYHDKERAETLKRLIQPFVLRRLKTDKSVIADLPDKLEMKVWCNLTREQATLYEAVVKDMLEQIEAAEAGIERRGLILSTLLKLKQVCNHPAQFVKDGSPIPGRSGKLARLEEMLEEALAAGDRALIFTQFSEMGRLLQVELQEQFNGEVLFLHGGTTKKQRDVMVERFQTVSKGQPALFILSLKAGGVGLNLTAANHVFHFDRWWNPAVENQATDRAFRIGQQRNVQVHKFTCIGTLEERIDTMIEQKKGLAESIVGSSENWITEMSTTQLKELFTLSRAAIAE